MIWDSTSQENIGAPAAFLIENDLQRMLRVRSSLLFASSTLKSTLSSHELFDVRKRDIAARRGVVSRRFGYFLIILVASAWPASVMRCIEEWSVMCRVGTPSTCVAAL